MRKLESFKCSRCEQDCERPYRMPEAGHAIKDSDGNDVKGEFCISCKMHMIHDEGYTFLSWIERPDKTKMVIEYI